MACQFLNNEGCCKDNGEACPYLDDEKAQMICNDLTDTQRQARLEKEKADLKSQRFADDETIDEELAAFCREHGIPPPKDLKPAPM